MTHTLRTASLSARCCATLALLAACAAQQTQPDTSETPAHRARAAQAELLRQSEEFGRAGDGMRAEQYLALALERGADSSQVTRRLVDACVRDQRYRAAADYAHRHLLRHPADSEIRFVRAVLLLGLDEPTAAARELEQLLAFDAAHALAHYVLGSLQREQLSDPVSADTHFRAYLELAPRGTYAEHARSLALRPVSTASVELAPATGAPETLAVEEVP
jgi:predicted Zn-dependent protease